MTTLEQVKTYVQNHLVAVVAAPIVATSVVALVAFPTIATGYQTLIGKSEKGPWGKFNLNNYEVIKKVLGSKKEKTSGEEYENNNGDENKIHEEEPIKGDENQMQQGQQEPLQRPPVDFKGAMLPNQAN